MLRLDINIVWTILNLLIIFAIVKIFLIKPIHKILDNADKNAALEEQKRIQQAQEQIAGLVVEATAKLVAAKQNADSDRELYNQFIAKTGEEID